MKINEIYKSVLSFAGMTADEYGFVSVNLVGKQVPTEISGKRLTLPTRENLSKPEGKIFFHAFSENALHGESEVFKKYKDVVNTRLNLSIGFLMLNLLNIVVSPSIHPKLTPEQKELLKVIGDPNDKSYEDLNMWIQREARKDPSMMFTNIYIKRGGYFGGEKHGRVAIVSFPFHSLLKQESIPNMRKRDVPVFNNLFEFIFPEVEEEEYYNAPSNSMTAPYMESLLRSAHKISSRINEVANLYKDYITDIEDLTFDLSWTEQFDEIDKLKGVILEIPPQVGNEGARSIVDKRTDEQFKPVNTSAIQVEQPQPTPQPAPQPVQEQVVPGPAPTPVQSAPGPVTGSKTKVDFNTLMGQQYQSQPQAPQYQTPMQPGMYQGQPMYPGQQPNIATQINSTPPTWLVQQDQETRAAMMAQQQQLMAQGQIPMQPGMYQGQPPMGQMPMYQGHPQMNQSQMGQVPMYQGQPQMGQPMYSQPMQPTQPGYAPGAMTNIASTPPRWL